MARRLHWGCAPLLSERPCVVASSFSSSPPAFAASATAGTLAGLALTTFLTRDLDTPKLPPLSLAPVGPKGSLGASVGLRF